MKKNIMALLVGTITLFCGCGILPSNLINPVVEKEKETVFSIPEEERLKLHEKQAFSYFYNKFSNDEKEIYLMMEYLIENQITEEVLTTDEEKINRIFYAILDDHPEIYYTNGYSLIKNTDKNGYLLKLSFGANYTYKREYWDEYNRDIEIISEEILKEIEKKETDYEKIKAIYEYVIKNTEYNLVPNDTQTIISSLLKKESVCQGYAKMFQYLANKAGIECLLVNGHLISGELHTWNIVKADNDYYHVDCTLGDANYTYYSQGLIYALEDLKTINYDYLLIDDKKLSLTHVIEDDEYIPLCSSCEKNYYVMENLLLKEFDREQVRKLVENACLEGRNSITMKCDSQEIYEKACEWLFIERNAFEFDIDKNNDGRIEYVVNDRLKTITLFLNF